MKLSAKVLKQLVQEEVKKFGEPVDLVKKAKETEEVDADEYADTLEKHIDMMKALKIEEARLKKRLVQIQERKVRLAKLIVK